MLRALSGQGSEGATTSAIAATTGIARPTTHRLLTSLNREGLVDRDASGNWQLGPELHLMGAIAAQRYDVAEIAAPFVRELAARTGESAFFSARRGEETVCLLREEGSFPIRSHVLHEGIRFPLGVASAGLAILAHLPRDEIDRYLEQHSLEDAYGAAHRAEEIRSRIRHTREAGYAVNPGLIVEDSWGIGAAVFNAQGRPEWALSLTGIKQRFGDERRQEMGTQLLRAAHALTGAINAGRHPS